MVSINVVLGPVSTWMGDRLWAGKPSQYVTCKLRYVIYKLIKMLR